MAAFSPCESDADLGAGVDAGPAAMGGLPAAPPDRAACEGAPDRAACEGAGPDAAWARATSVVHLAGLLSPGEIAGLHDMANELQCEAASECRGGSASGTAWRVLYLQSDGAFERRLPALQSKLRSAALEADRASGWGLLSPLRPAEWSVRCAEYHRMGRSYGLPDPGHFDNGSLVTIDVMLSRPGVDHEGGAFCTREPDGSDTARGPEFAQGDALVFVAHKPHFVRPVTRGVRQVLVVEFWRGEARTCPHRCAQPLPGACALTLASARAKAEAEFEDAIFSVVDMPLLEAAMAALR